MRQPSFVRVVLVEIPEAEKHRVLSAVRLRNDHRVNQAWLAESAETFPGRRAFHRQPVDLKSPAQRRAVARSPAFNPMVVPKPDGGEDTMFLGLWYLDKYTRTKDGWRITERVEKKCYSFNMPDWMKKALKLA